MIMSPKTKKRVHKLWQECGEVGRVAHLLTVKVMKLQSELLALMQDATEERNEREKKKE